MRRRRGCPSRRERQLRCRSSVLRCDSRFSNAKAIGILRRAKQEPLPISVETCPHYLFFSSREIPRGATVFKCAPPIRDPHNRDRLWMALRQQTIDLVVSDHSPCSPELKCPDTGDFFRAWGGIASLQLGLSVMWTQMKGRHYSFEHLVRWMCVGPSRVAGLELRKGVIAAGYDADLVVWNPEEGCIVFPRMLFQRHPLTPYQDRLLHGTVETTFLGGEMIYNRGRFLGAPRGALLRRGQH